MHTSLVAETGAYGYRWWTGGVWLDSEVFMTQQLAYPDPPLAESAIRLRPWTLRDVSSVEQASHAPYIPTVTSVPSAYTDEKGRAWIGRQWQRLADGQGMSLCIADAHTDVALGFVGISVEYRARGRASLGYWVVPEARGRGVATAAVRLLSAWAFSTLGIPRLELLIEPDNLASQRVAERAGFQVEGVLRSYEEFRGRRADLIMYSRLATDLPDHRDILHGRVFTGAGDYARWIERYREYYRAKSGLSLFPGTLNLRLDDPYELPAGKVIRLEGAEYGSRVSVSILPVRLFDWPAFVLRPDLKQGASAEDAADRLSTLELAADVKLRDAYGLEDGDDVKVVVI